MARTLDIYEIFERFEKADSHEEKIKVLKQNEKVESKQCIGM